MSLGAAGGAPVTTRHRLRFVGLLAAVLVVVAGAAFVAGGSWLGKSVPAPSAPRLPDLVVLPLTDLLVGTDDQGNEALRFSATIANIGDGPLIIRARRAFSWNERWSVVQWFDEADGTQSGTAIAANLVFGGHGHEHWHLKFGASYRLFSEDGRVLASQTKAGFCFFDQVAYKLDLPAAPSQGAFDKTGCGNDAATSVAMGISVGWSDPYFWQLADQSVNITGIPDGRYRLTAEADPDGWLRETNDDNNGTWVVFDLKTESNGLRTITVVQSAEAP